jgi:hypothetical protein
MDGQIIGSEAPQPLFISAPIQTNHQSQAASTTSHTEDHDDHDDHEDHEDHDD